MGNEPNLIITLQMPFAQVAVSPIDNASEKSTEKVQERVGERKELEISRTEKSALL